MPAALKAPTESEPLLLLVDDVRGHWDLIREGVATALKGDSNERAEDVYAALVYKKASLYLGEDAFFVMRLSDDDGIKTVRIWVMYSWGSQGALERYNDDVSRIARSVGATQLAFTTCRPGFQRRIPDGWSKGWTTYIKSI